MKKYKLSKQKKKVFAAVLAASLTMSSIAPESIVYAAETEVTEAAAQTEDSSEQTVNRQESEETEQPAESEEVTEPETETEEKELSEAVKALQERINALPTVEEFQAMADGTTVEDSTLNQKQTDVYNEAQAIADALDQLSEEEQGQVDTSKLEALFEYFNSMTEETVTTTRISSAGTYNIDGSTRVNISATGNVTLNLTGDMSFDLSGYSIINVSSACNVTINSNGHTVENTGTGSTTNTIQLSNSNANVTVNGGTYKITKTGAGPNISGGGKGTLKLNQCTIDGGSTGIYVAHLTLTGTTVKNCSIGITGADMTAIGCKFNKCTKAIDIWDGDNVKLSGNTVFSGNTNDIYLRAKAVISLANDYNGNAKVTTADTISANAKRQITTANTSTDMLSKLSPTDSSCSVNYDTSGKYLYLWKHAHNWSYSANGNTVTAKCGTSSCGYYANGLTLTLIAPDMQFTGSAYNKASVTNEISSVTGASAGSIEYYNGSTKISAPTNVGSYTAKVTIGGKTASVNFNITKADSTVSGTPVHPVNNLTYTGSDLTLVSADNVTNGEIYYRVGKDGSWQNTLPTGIDAGKYEIFYYVKGDANHKDNGSEENPMGSCKVTVAKKQITATADGFDGIFDENAARSIQVNVTDPVDGYKVTYSITGKEGSYTEENPSFTEAGTYTVYYRVEAGDNYQAATGSATVKIAGATFAEGDITAEGYNGTYDGAAHKISVETKETADGAAVTYSTTGAKDSYTDEIPEFKNATDGTKTVYYKVSKKGYQDQIGTVDVSIARKNVTATVSVKEKVYDGTTNADVEAYVDTGIKNENLTVSGVTGTFASKDAAENIEVSVNSNAMTVTAGEGTRAENYNVSCEAKSSGKITKAAVAAPEIASKQYTGETQTADVADTEFYTVTKNEGGQKVGSYPVILTLKDANNYKWESTEEADLELTFKITSIQNSWTIEPSISSWTYGDTANTPEGSSKYGTVSVTYAKAGSEEFTSEVPTEAGTYTARFTVEGTDSYSDLSEDITFTIAAREVTVTVADKTITYGDAEPAYTSEITEGSLVGKDDLALTYSREQGTAAKTYAITVASANSNYKVNVVKGTLTIQKKDLTITPKKASKVYGDADPQFRYSVSGLVKGEKEADILTGVLARDEGENKGTYAYKIGSLADASGNYNVNFDADAAEFTITAKEITLTWSRTNLTYNGSEQSVTAQVSNPAFDSDSFTLEYTGNTAANAGSYTAEVTSVGNDNYVLTKNSNQKVNWSIAKTDAQYQLPEAVSGLTYNGADQTLVTAENPDGGTWMYKVGDGKWSDQLPTGLDAGTYTISYKVVGDDNHKDSAEGQLTVVIAKKAVVVSGITAEDKTYDGNIGVTLKFDRVKFDGLLEKDSLSVSAEGVFEDKNAGEKKVLVSGLALDGASVKNYVLAKDGQQSETTAMIHAKEITAVITPNGGIYEGTITPATVVLNGLVGEDNPEVTLTYAGTANDGTVVGSDGKGSTEVPTHAGTYTVTASITNDNYSLKAEGASAQFVVAKADPALSVSAVADKNYGEEAFKLESTNKGDGQKSYASSDEKVVTVDENGLVTIVGAGKATLTVSLSESANYNAGEKTVTVTINKVNHTLVVDKLAYEVTYGDPTFKIAASAGDKETDIKFTSNDKDVASVNADGTVTVGKVGTAKITVSMDESQNYLAVAKEVTVTVVPKEVTVTPNDAFKVYGDKDKEFSYTPNGLVGNDSLSGITLTRAEGEDVGTYDITASVEKDANPNYSVKFNKGTFTITQKEIGITWADTKLTYNGKDQQPSAFATGLVGKDTCEVTVTGAQKNAGTYTATATKLSNKNYKLPAETTTEYTIGAKEIGIDWSNLEFTYDGTKKQPTAKATGLVDGDTCGITVSGAAADAGNHTAKAEAVDNANYKLPKDVETKFVIKKAETVVSQTPEIISGLTYTGDAQDLISAGKTEDGKFVYKVNDGEWSETIPSGLDAGTYEISYKVMGDDNHNDSTEVQFTVTIAKKAIVVSGITAEDKTYDGNTSVVLNYDGVKFDGLLEKDSLSVSAEGTFENKNAGEKKVLLSSLTLDGASVKNYELAKAGQQAETTATIHAKEITATITPNGGIYEGTITPATVVLNGLVGEDNPEIALNYAGTANDGTEADGTVPTHAGTYTVTAFITDSNYHLKAEGASAQFVVAKADPALSVSAVADKNYGEEAFKLETSSKGDGQKSYASSDDKVVTVDENGLVTIVGAGKATLTVSLSESANYTAGQKEMTITVNKTDHSLAVEEIAYEVTYGDPAFKIASDAGDKETDIKFTSNDEDVVSVSADGTVTIGNVGTAKITISMDESQNHLAVAKEVTVTVAPKEVSVTPDDASKVYGDKDGEFTYHADGLVRKDTLSGITLARAEGEDVGIYDITASEEKDANPNYSVKFNKGTFIIAQKEIGLTWADTKLTYNGKDQQPSASATGLVGNDTCEVTVTGAQKNAGTYTATATKLSNKNYKLPAETTTEYTIGAKEIGIEWSNLEFTYDGTKKQPTAKAIGLVDGDTCGITVSGAAADAGRHTAKAESTDNANYKLPKDAETEFVIKKAEADFQAPEAVSGLTYNGEDQILISAGQTEKGKFVYKVNGGEWSETIPSGLDAGTYEISYKVVGDDNHNDSEERRITVTIAKKAVVVSGITAEDKTYDGNTSAVLNYDGVKFDGLLETDSLSITAVGAFEDKNAGQKKVLVSNLILGGTSIKNYVLAAEGQQEYTTAAITAKEITVVIISNGGTYEGVITPATAVLNGLAGEDDPEITLTYTGTANDGTKADGKMPTHAGTYTVTASIMDSNYSLKAEGASAQFVVAKADPALTVSAVTDKNYGEEAFKLESANKGDGQKSYTSSDEKVVTVDENGLVTIVGAGKATLTVSLEESANYTADKKEITITVNKTDHSLVVEKIAYEVVYGDPAFKITSDAGDQETDIQFTSDREDVALVSADGTVTIGNVGTAKITISMDESQNHLAAVKEVTVTVVPKEIGIAWSNLEFIYDGTRKQPTATATGLVKDDTCGLTISGAAVDVGTHIAKAEALDNANYKLPKDAETEFVIRKADVDVQAPEAVSGLIYNGETQKLITDGKTADGTLLYKVDGSEWTESLPTGLDAGTYTVYYKVVGDSNHKDSEEGSLTVTIHAKEITAVITPNGGTYEGTITPATAVLNGLIGGDKPEITLTYTGTANDGTKADGSLPTHAGTYTVTASIADGNYRLKAEGTSAEFVVAKADPALTVSRVADKNYGDEAFKLETSNKGDGQKSYASSNEKVVTVDENGLVTIVGAGKATLTVSLAESENYNAAVETVAVNVLPKTVTEKPDSNVKKDDSKQNGSNKDNNGASAIGNNTKKNNTSNTTGKKSPKTGDTTNAAGYGITMLLSLAAALGAFLRRKKKPEK